MICTICGSDKHRASSCPRRLWLLPIILLLVAWPHAALAHDWYPVECCHGYDCAPVDKAEMVVPFTSAGMFAKPHAQLLVTTRDGTVLVPDDFPRRQSPDGQMHACIRSYPDGTKRLLCLFLPPAS